MRQGYTVRDRGVRRIGGVLLAAGLLCAGWGAASEEGAGDGIRQLCASPKGDVIGTVVWDEQREAAVFVRDAATGAVRTVFRASGARVSLSLMPGSTPAFASWDAFVSDDAEAAADADPVRQTAYWYDGGEVRRDEWRTGRLCILRQALPARRSYLVTSAFAEGADAASENRIYEVDPTKSAAVAAFDVPSLPHPVSGFGAMRIEEDAHAAGPVLWLCSYAAAGAAGRGAFAEGRPRAWIDAVAWSGDEPAPLDSVELIHESEAWDAAPAPEGGGILVAASPSIASVAAGPWATPLRARWDAAAGRIVLEGGQPLSLRLSEDAASDPAWAITGQGVRITPESLIYLVQYADAPCSVFRALLADYGEANLLTDAAARRAECAAVSETGDAVVTWDGFAFDLYAPDGTADGLAKVGAWTLQISADGAPRAEPRS